MNDQDLPAVRYPDDPFDRRQAGNTSVQWVRDAFREQNAKIDHLSEVVHEISNDLKSSWQDGKPEKHWDEHELFREREKERQRLEALREAERAERAEFIKSLKKEALSWGIKAFALFLVGVFAVGGQEQFRQAVRWAMQVENTQEVKK